MSPFDVDRQRPDVERLIREFFAGDCVGEIKYEGDSYYPTINTADFIPDGQRRDHAEAQLLQIGGSVVEPLVEYVSRWAQGWPSPWTDRELPRVMTFLSKLCHEPTAVEALYKVFDYAAHWRVLVGAESIHSVLVAVIAGLSDERAVETLRQDRERSEAERRRQEEKERREKAALAKLAQAHDAEEARRHAIRVEREAARVCVLCGKPLGLLQKLCGAKQHKGCAVFSVSVTG